MFPEKSPVNAKYTKLTRQLSYVTHADRNGAPKPKKVFTKQILKNIRNNGLCGRINLTTVSPATIIYRIKHIKKYIDYSYYIP